MELRLLLPWVLVAGCNRAEPAPAVPATEPPAQVPACLGLGPDDACHNASAPQSSVALRNVRGGSLEVCSTDPMTGWTREGLCTTGPTDAGVHVVCAEMTEDFLAFTKARGNDLSTPHPGAGFQGLAAGDRWCLCASRWAEAETAGVAPIPVLGATHEAALRIVEPARLGL